jgi:hypothetical protein
MPKSLLPHTFSDNTSQPVMRLDGCSSRSPSDVADLRHTAAATSRSAR